VPWIKDYILFHQRRLSECPISEGGYISWQRNGTGIVSRSFCHWQQEPFV